MIMDEEILYDLADLFRIFSDSTRIRILNALEEGERSVGDLCGLTGMTQSAVSHQLRVLKDSRLVRFRREGKNVLYALADEHVRTILETGLEHLGE